MEQQISQDKTPRTPRTPREEYSNDLSFFQQRLEAVKRIF